MHTKICAQQQSKITREMIGRSRDGNGGDLEYIIKPSQSQQGAHLSPAVLSCPTPWDVGEQRGRKPGGSSSGVHQEHQEGAWFGGESRKGGDVGMGIPTQLSTPTSPSSVTQK